MFRVGLLSTGLRAARPRITAVGGSRIPLAATMLPLAGLGMRFKSDATTTATEITTEIGKLGNDVADQATQAVQAAGAAGGDAVTAAVSAVSPDKIGYFESLGLAQSWVWPSDIFQHIFEYVHVYTGLPWWGTILAVTLTTRVLMFPLYTSASDSSARMARIKPQLTDIMERTKRASEQIEIQKLMIERKKLMVDNDIKIGSMLKPVLSVPIFLGVFNALRGMSSHPVAGMTDEGFAWFTNLAAADPYCGLQIFTALVYAITFKYFGGETGTAHLSPAMKKAFTYMPFIAVPLTMSLPAGVCYYFAINGIFSIVQSNVLKWPSARKFLKLSPLVTPEEQKAIEAATGNVKKQSDSIIGALRQKYEDAKEQAEKKVQEQEKAKQQKRDEEIAESSQFVQMKPKKTHRK